MTPSAAVQAGGSRPGVTGALGRRDEYGRTPAGPSGLSAVPGALVAAGVRRVRPAGGGSADDVRGRALGALGVQLAALAVPLRPPRGRELGALPEPPHPLEPRLGAHRLSARLHPFR